MQKKRASTKKKKKTQPNDEDIMSEQSKIKSGRWTNAVQLALRRKKDKMQLGWHLLEDTNRCKVMTYAFIYYYDNLKNCFKISTDITSYTVSDLTWDFIEDY